MQDLTATEPSGRTSPILRRLLEANVVAIVIAMVVIVPLVAPVSAAWVMWRSVLFQGMGVLLLLAALARVEPRGGFRRFFALLRSGVTLPLLLYFAWAALATARAPDRTFSRNELLLLGVGVLVCLIVAWHLENRSQLSMLCHAVVLIVGLTLLYGLVIQSRPGEVGVRSSFGTRMMFGGFLALITPLLAALAIAQGLYAGDAARARQLAITVVTVLAGIALMLTQCRSAWAGGGLGFLLLGAMLWRSSPPGTGRLESGTRGLGAAFLVLVFLLSGAVIFGLGGTSAVLRQRVGTLRNAALGQDVTFAWRVKKWKETLPMIASRPVMGWGLGSYPFQQARLDTPGGNPPLITLTGVSLDEMAHNEYLQLGAELGLVGLGLYLLVLASFFAKAGRALGRLPYGFRKLVLMGCVAGLTAQVVDAGSNPAWRFPECAMFFWLFLGMGTACVRMAYADSTGSPTYRKELS